MVDLVGSHLDLYRRMQARIGPDILGTLSADERDEKLKDALVVGGELYPALISLDAEYKVSIPKFEVCSFENISHTLQSPGDSCP